MYRCSCLIFKEDAIISVWQDIIDFYILAKNECGLLQFYLDQIWIEHGFKQKEVLCDKIIINFYILAKIECGL